MPSARRASRAAALVSGAAVVAALLGPTAALASGSAGGTSVTVLPTTTTVARTAPSTTTVPATTTSTTKPTTSTTKPGTGVPKVPVGGPPTTTPKKNAPPPPPPDPLPILTAVQTDVSQLQAISDYRPAEAGVAARQRAVTQAGAGLETANVVLTSALRDQASAQRALQSADDKLKQLAIAAYIGVGFASPEAGPQDANSSNGTVSTPGGLSGLEAADATEMLTLVGQRVRQGVKDSTHQLKLAQKATAKARSNVAKAEKVVAQAEGALLASQQTLQLVAEAATTPGAAIVDLLNLPSAKQLSQGVAAQPPASGAFPPVAVPATQLSGAVNASVDLPVPTSPTILGPSLINGAELAGWFATTKHKPNITVTMAKLAADYENAGKATGVRYDLAFAQSIVETGYFSFPTYGQLTPKDNNFAGIGACDSCSHGWSFPNAATGVGAQLELLEAYASSKPVKTPLLHGAVGVGGCCPTWMALSGTWASSLVYGISILTVYNRMLSWVIPRRLVQSGLIASSASAQAQGPSLAPLGH